MTYFTEMRKQIHIGFYSDAVHNTHFSISNNILHRYRKIQSAIESQASILT